MNVVQEIKGMKNLSLRTYFLSSYLISNRISPYLSAVYIKRGISPNTITLQMILSGIIGAILFSLPNIYLKILGAFMIHLWFILDCSDGEVAKYTKNFSKYGKELDYMAHLINHPLFGFAFLMSMLQFGKYNIIFLVILVSLSNLIDYLTRNLFTLSVIVELKESSENRFIGDVSSKWTLREKVLFITNIFSIYPNFVLFGVIVYFVDYCFHTDILFYYLILNVILSGLSAANSLLRYTRKFCRS